MKKRKGFTLIELLAVIVILAIIIIIAVPKILDVIENSRMSAFKSSADLIAEDARIKYLSDKMNSGQLENVYTFENGDYKVGSPKLNFKGEKPDNGVVKLNDKGKVALALVSKNGKYCATKTYDQKNSVVITTENGICKVDDDVIAIVPEENIKTYTVTFNDDGTKTKADVKAQKKVSEKEPKGKEGYAFKYWSLTENGEEYDFNTPVTENITLYAVYEKSIYIVTFNDDGSATRVEVNDGEKVSKIQSKGKEGYVFKYWSLTENGSEYDFNTPVTGNITLYAVYKIEIVTLSSNVKLGDYITYMPTTKSYIPNTTLTGCAETSTCSQSSVNPSELTSWRVLNINSDGTVEIISTNVSTTQIYFYGKTGYLNSVKVLNDTAKKYINSAYAISARSVGYGGQTESVTNTTAITQTTVPWTTNTSDNSRDALGGGDVYYLTDYNQMASAGIPYGAVNNEGTSTWYWFASRIYFPNYVNGKQTYWNFTTRFVRSYDIYNSIYILYHYDARVGFVSSLYGFSIRPVVTLKSGLKATGIGTIENPYILQ